MSRVLYLISDLHIGGDGELEICDFEEELLEFLKMLEASDEDAELIINGDAFGLWEFTTLEGVDKLNALIQQQAGLFEQFKATGSRIPITLMPGNHDYELACYPEFIPLLHEYNIRLEPVIHLVREVAGKKIWIEHGQQHDSANKMPDFGNPYAQPLGYFITRNVVGNAGKHSDFGRGNWLKDVQSVVPMEDIPLWMASNYFYNEMSPTLRWLLLPFLLLFGLTFLVLLAFGLEFLGLFDYNVVLSNPVMSRLGPLETIVRFVVAVDTAVLVLLLPLSIPLAVVLRDVRRTLERFQVAASTKMIEQKDAAYIAAAHAVFRSNPDVAVYIFGHTHDAFVRREGDRAIVNTGTWLKLLERIPVRLGYLPPVYRPHFRLMYSD